MENLKITIDKTNPFIKKEDIFYFKKEISKHIETLHNKTGKGNDFLGWTNLPSSIKEEELHDIQQTAERLKEKADIVVVVGIGGSYLGSKAIIEALSHSYVQLMRNRRNPIVLFAGQNISEDYHFELCEILKDCSWAMIVISKSGTTTEPAIAFRVLKQELERKYGKSGARTRIVAITDHSKGALRQLANNEGYKTFVIPDDVGGRYSVLTPVGLLPIAVAGFDIRKLVGGARAIEAISGVDSNFEDNPVAIYAATRNALYRKGKTIEIMVNYNPKLHFFAEWWKQLYGESEGKENKGIFPGSVDFTSDLHSMGQYIQDGPRNLFETVISIQNTVHKLLVPGDEENLDKLNFLADKRFDEINKMAELGTMLAHVDGEVPNIRIELPELNEYYLGQLIYFFEKACGISGYILGVNPFDQPGVEAYKNNMFALLEKPGFEEQTKQLKKRL
jgi:glucose-6-phosphate isomerase